MKGNMGGMMKQMQKMQKDMEKAQNELLEMEFEAYSGGGMMTVKESRRRDFIVVEINEDGVDQEDVEMLQDLVLAATNDVMKQIEDKTEATMGKYTKGLNIPGMF